MRRASPFPAPSLELPLNEERAACPRCGGLLVFPAGRERLACAGCRADWLRPVASARALVFETAGRRLAFGRRWIGVAHRPRYPFHHALHAEPEVRKLAAEFGVPRRLRGKTQWERQRDLLRVLRIELFRHRPPAPVLRRLALWTIARTNRHWYCTHLAYFYSAFAASLGWTARILNIGRDHLEKTDGHMIAEIWNDDWQKWVMVDPLFAAWFSRRGRPSEPLSFFEVRQDWLRGGGRRMILHHRVRSASQDLIGPERTLPALRDDTRNRSLHPSHYFWAIAYLSNRFLTEPYEDGRFLALFWRDRWNTGRAWYNRDKPVGYYRARHVVETSTPLDFHPPLNNTAVWLLRDAVRPRVFLRAYCPNFARFEMKRDGAWRRIPAEFPLPPAHGRFAWEFRAVNRFGVAGKPAALTGIAR
ncbi:MAG: hypothetical protein IT578_01845 [Verrucomicrobiae bacterium]|nr:hypothetical protein [Verrucomicrobiae bacterium]